MSKNLRLSLLLGAAVFGISGAGAGIAFANGPSQDSLPDVALVSSERLQFTLDNARALADGRGNAAQRTALADGRVSPPEYAAATEDMLSCLTTAGFAIESVETDWSGLTYDYVVRGPADGEAAYQDCYDRTSRAVDIVYQSITENTKASLAASVAKCLIDGGIRPDKLITEEGTWEPAAVAYTASGEKAFSGCASQATQVAKLVPLPALKNHD